MEPITNAVQLSRGLEDFLLVTLFSEVCSRHHASRSEIAAFLKGRRESNNCRRLRASVLLSTARPLSKPFFVESDCHSAFHRRDVVFLVTA